MYQPENGLGVYGKRCAVHGVAEDLPVPIAIDSAIENNDSLLQLDLADISIPAVFPDLPRRSGYSNRYQARDD